MDIDLQLWRFSIKLEGDGWEGEQEVDLREGRCKILTGKNAGGKTLTLRALYEFCNILKNPTARKKKHFQRLAESAGIEEISVRFGYKFFEQTDPSTYNDPVANLLPWFQLDSDEFNWRKYDQRLGFNAEPGTRQQPQDWMTDEEIDEFPYCEYGDELAPDRVTGFVILDRGFYTTPPPDPVLNPAGENWWKSDGMQFTVSEECSAGCGRREITHEMIENRDYSWWNKGIMRSFGPVYTAGTDEDDRSLHTNIRQVTGWVDRLFDETGIRFQYNENYGENYAFEDPSKHYNFEVLAPEQLSVTEAYEIESDLISDLREIHDSFVDPSGAEVNPIMRDTYESYIDEEKSKIGYMELSGWAQLLSLDDKFTGFDEPSREYLNAEKQLLEIDMHEETQNWLGWHLLGLDRLATLVGIDFPNLTFVQERFASITKEKTKHTKEGNIYAPIHQWYPNELKVWCNEYLSEIGSNKK